VVLSILFALTVFARPGAAQEVPELRITSARYIVIDAETGEVFAQRGADDPVPMASLTKIFTAIEAIEAAPPDLAVTTSADDLVSGDATQMGFAPAKPTPSKTSSTA
jgi:D-alanyl-D-alanine carboxypeptidase